ncbi:MAG TPA: T9SS type A sorting domain-containing protein [Bacteroidia bacterium]|jgi:hypothetical protein
MKKILLSLIALLGFLNSYGQLPCPVETPSICMVTCDGASVNNIVYWDKTAYTSVDSFIIYRETAPFVYTRIGAVSKDSLSEFHDTARSIGPANGDPDLASYKYKIGIRDTCGIYGPLSLYHSTIHITDNGSGMFSWSQPYTIEGLPTPVTNYVLLCDTANVDVWGPVQTVGSAASSAIDPGFANHASIANWRVKTLWSIECTPTRATVNTTRSNIKNGVNTNGIKDVIPESIFIVYPNPASGYVNVSFSPGISSAFIRIINVLGQEVFSKAQVAGTITLDVQEFSKGMYTVIIENDGKKTFSKLIIK